MQISLILHWWYFSCLSTYSDKFLEELKMFFQIFLSKVYRSVVLKNYILWIVDIIFINKFQISWIISFNISTQKDEWEQSELFNFKKQNNRKQFSCFKFYLKINFCYFFHFSDLQNLVKCMNRCFHVIPY